MAGERERSERMTAAEAAVLTSLSKSSTKLRVFEDGSRRSLLVDPEAARWYVLEDTRERDRRGAL
jgi:hypothetical protein